MKFSQISRIMRKELGLTQAQLAKELQLSFATVNRWETEKTIPNKKMAHLIVEYAEKHHVSIATQKQLKQTLTFNELQKFNKQENPKPFLLAVDDLPMNRDLLRMAFEPSYEVLTASDGIEALERLREYPISVIVTDIVMMPMDGLELIQKIRQHEQYKHIPIVAITEYNEVEQQKAITLGANDFITKPFDTALLRQRVQGVIQKNNIQKMIESCRFIFDHSPMPFVLVQLLRNNTNVYQTFYVSYINVAALHLLNVPLESVANLTFSQNSEHFPDVFSFFLEVLEAPTICHKVFYDKKWNQKIGINAYRQGDDFCFCFLDNKEDEDES